MDQHVWIAFDIANHVRELLGRQIGVSVSAQINSLGRQSIFQGGRLDQRGPLRSRRARVTKDAS